MIKHHSPVDTSSGMTLSPTYAADLAAEQQTISLGDATQMISNFDADIMSSYDAFPICETFKLATIQNLLNAPGCIGIRIYNGLDGDGNVCFVLASVNQDGTDLTMDGATEGQLAEDGQRYPDKKKPGNRRP